jgi:hypothetical protein
MIRLSKEELHAFFPGLVMEIQKHHNMEDIAEELFIRNCPTRGLSHTRNYFLEILNDGIYLQYVMEHIIVEPRLYLVARSLREVILYEGKKEWDVARVVDQSNAKAKQNFELN